MKNINEMTLGDCCYIFKNIEIFSNDEECYAAIRRVLKMETRNSITKTDMMDVIRWLMGKVNEGKDK